MTETKKKSTSKKTIKSEKKTASKNRHIGAEKRKADLPAKRKRQYRHILESEKKDGKSTAVAKRIAMATVNKTRKKKKEVKSKSK
jgi:hypothetical protein